MTQRECVIARIIGLVAGSPGITININIAVDDKGIPISWYVLNAKAEGFSFPDKGDLDGDSYLAKKFKSLNQRERLIARVSHVLDDSRRQMVNITIAVNGMGIPIWWQIIQSKIEGINPPNESDPESGFNLIQE
jgi:hypothetical protein